MADWQPYPAAYGPPVAPGPKVPGAVLFGVTVWRLVIVIFAITGFSMAMASADGSGALAALSQQASLVTAICYLLLLLYPAFTGGRKHEPDSPWLRGQITVLLSLVSVTFLTMLNGDLSQGWSLFEHLLTPLAVLADWLFVGRDQRNAKWWYPITWLSFPLAYLLFYIAHGDVLYPFLDPQAGDFAGIVVGFLAGVLVYGFVVFGLGMLHGRPRPTAAPQPFQPQQPMLPQQPMAMPQMPVQQPMPPQMQQQVPPRPPMGQWGPPPPPGRP